MFIALGFNHQLSQYLKLFQVSLTKSSGRSSMSDLLSTAAAGQDSSIKTLGSCSSLEPMVQDFGPQSVAVLLTAEA